MSAYDENELIGKAKNGDKQAFEKLIEINQTHVYNLALKLMKSSEDALDISQDVFLKAFIKLKEFRGDCKFSAWLYRLTYNRCIDVMRKAKKSNIIPLNTEDEDGDEKTVDIPDTESDPAKIYDKRSTAELIRAEIDKLPEEQRRVIILREFAGLSYAEIAEETKTGEGTVKSRISRARQSLAKALAKQGTFNREIRHNNREEVTGDE